MKVGVVGLGRMGEPIARRLLTAGYELTVFNRTPERASRLTAAGALAVDTPRAIWETAAICITMVSDDKALSAVMLGPAGLLTNSPRRYGIVIEMSTVSVDVSRTIAEAAKAAHVAYLRAPVSGNPSVVEARKLAIMVSGTRKVFDAVEPLLLELGPNVSYVGGGEEARVMKLALNLMLAGTTELMAEALVLGEAAGLSRDAMLDVMATSAVGSPFIRYKTGGLIARDYATTFSTAGMAKDLTLALETGSGMGVPLPATALVRQLLEACIVAGMGDLDFTALLPRLQHEAGVPADV